MAKKQNTKKRQRSKQPAVVNNNDGANDDDGNDQESSWQAVPGKRLPVDIANDDDAAAATTRRNAGGKKRPRPTTTEESNSQDDEFDTEKWTSQHYDDSDDDESVNNQRDRDLFDPDPLSKTNKFDAKSKFEGANESGMFLSLEVIPGDAYKVKKIGDEASGFVTKVVFTKTKSQDESAQVEADEKKSEDEQPKEDNKRERARKKREAREAASGKVYVKPKPKTEEEVKADALSRLERLKVKRKAKKEVAKERKRLRMEKLEKSSSSEDASSKPQEPQGTEPQEPSSSKEETAENSVEQAVAQLSTTWSIAAPGLSLHNTLASGLHSLQFAYPTPIQSATLPAAILGRRDIVGAAPTGSGKTLSYGLPILQYLLENADAPSTSESSTEQATSQATSKATQQLPLQALILTPTRELAMQVTAELQKVSMNSIKIGTIVGGFAEVKQKRTLEKVKPPVIVATPGRLWELMSSKDYTHLNDLTQLRFLVIDEADRMIKQGSFPQLKQIFELINLANPPPEDDDSEEESESDEEEDDRLKSLNGVRGEAKLVMLNDTILEAIERQKNGGSSAPPKPMEMEDDEYEEQQQLLDEDDSGSENDSDDEAEPVHRQTFVYSATLTLPPSMHNLIKKDPAVANKKRRRNKGATTVDGAIAEILDIAGARGQTKVCDMSNTVPEGKTGKNSKKQDAPKKGEKVVNEPTSLARRLPPGLTLGEIPCAQRHKDSHLYAYLTTTRQGSSGPCLVFCNSIAAVRRVGDTLKHLGLPVKMLHAQMLQKSRLGALESLRTSNSRSIVVCSDVAARGLDISSVTTVIHYDVARVVDTFIHRAGRTARGVGEKAVGTSISLVAPAEEREHQKICEAVRGSGSRSLERVHIDSRLLNEATERVALATKIVSCNDVETQATRKNKWLRDAAEQAELEVDDDMMEGGLLDGDLRDRQRFIEAKRAKGELRELLAKPMRKQHFGKFLSGVGLRESIKAEVAVKPFVVKESVPKPKPRRRKVLKKK